MTFSAPERGRGELLSFPFALFFFVVTWLSLLVVVDAIVCWWSALLGAAVMAGLYFAEKRKKLFFSLLGALFALWLVALFMNFDAFRTGLKILCNNLFEKSEAAQAYRYEYFSVSVVRKLYPRYLAIALVFSVLPVSLLFYGAGRERNGVALFFLMLLFSFVCVAFGVTAGGALIALQGVAAILYFLLPRLTGKGKRVLFAVVLVCLLVAAIFALSALYRPSEALSAFSERVRDLFDEKMGGILGGLSGGNGALPSEGGSSGEGSELATSVRRLPILLIAFAAVALLSLCFPLAHAIKKIVRRRGEKKKFFSPDPKIAIKAYFSLSMERLRALGVAYRNIGYRNYRAEIAEKFGEAYAESYEKASRLYEKTLYSDALAGEEERLAAKEFYEKTIRLKKGGSK